MVTSTSAGISQRTAVYAARDMLRHAKPVLVLEKFGKTIPMPLNKGVNPKFRRPIPLDPSMTPLVEGVTPTSTPFAYEDVTTKLDQYGEYIVVTDVIEDTHEDPVLKDATVQLGENMGRTMEQLTYNVIRGGTNVLYSNGAVRTAVNTPITLARQRASTRALKRQKGMKISRILSGSDNYETYPVEASYVAIAHTDVEADIRELPGFVPVARYGTLKPYCPEEIGSVEDVRYVLSPDLEPFENAGGAAGGMISTGGTSADVYPVIYLAKDAFGVVALRGKKSVFPIIHPVGMKSKDDPLMQRGTVGWKSWHAALVLNELWMARLEVAVTEL